MRHAASMVTAMEGVNRPVYQIAKELSQNSRSGLTVRFLSKKLELPEEEIEYLVDVNHKLLFTDLTKIKLPAEGVSAVKRISDGLENLGDVPALFRKIKSLPSHDFRRIEDLVSVERPGAKKAVAEQILKSFYTYPESVVEYVATATFSETAREVFDIVWQSKDGVMAVPKIRAAHGGSEYDVEQALWELFRGVALFEMFRFDAEDRLIRVAGLLSEVRQWREQTAKSRRSSGNLKGRKTAPNYPQRRGLGLTNQICQLVASLAAKSARVRGDGELFREDLRRLSKTIDEEAIPSLDTCIWAAESVGWIARVDNELRAGELSELIDTNPYDRHKMLFDWMMTTEDEATSHKVLVNSLDDLRSDRWYSVMEFIEHAVRVHSVRDRYVLKSSGGHYHYISPSVASNIDTLLARSLEETLFWLGVVDLAEDEGTTYFRITDLGRVLLTNGNASKIKKDSHRQSTEIIVQPNFDIVVPTLDMDPLLTVSLDQFADRQSTGHATVYHLNKDSFTRGLQDGHDGDAFVEYLLTHNRGGSLPTNVMTTLDDWRGGLRRVRVHTVHVLESDDPLVIADLRHRKKFQKYIQLIDSHRVVRYSDISKAELLKQLEKDGFIVD